MFLVKCQMPRRVSIYKYKLVISLITPFLEGFSRDFPGFIILPVQIINALLRWNPSTWPYIYIVWSPLEMGKLMIPVFTQEFWATAMPTFFFRGHLHLLKQTSPGMKNIKLVFKPLISLTPGKRGSFVIFSPYFSHHLKNPFVQVNLVGSSSPSRSWRCFFTIFSKSKNLSSDACIPKVCVNWGSILPVFGRFILGVQSHRCKKLGMETPIAVAWVSFSKWCSLKMAASLRDRPGVPWIYHPASHHQDDVTFLGSGISRNLQLPLASWVVNPRCTKVPGDCSV